MSRTLTLKKLEFPRLLLYLFFGAAAFCLQAVGDNAEPLSLALVYAFVGVGFAPFPCAILGALPALLSFKTFDVFLLFAECILVAFGQFIQSKITKRGLQKSGLISLLCLTSALALFVWLAPFTVYDLPIPVKYPHNPITQKVLIAAFIFLLSAAFSVAVKALLKKFLKCRLRADEMVFSVLFLVLIGVGICRFLGLNAYMGTAFFVLLLFCCVTKDASGMLCAFCLSMPPLLTFGISPVKFFLFGAAICAVIKGGRIAASCALLLCFFGYGYFEGLYGYATPQLVSAILSALIPVLLFILIPTPAIRFLENKLIYYREKHLSRIAINRNRASVGEKLFEISAVFREIQATFTTLGASEAETGAKEYIRSRAVEESCANCPRYPVCEKKNLTPALDALVSVGCVKGKVTLIDIPRALADACNNQTTLLYALNRQLGEYRNYVTETENAATGRALLAGQAQGVSEILKALALEQSQPLQIYTQKERALNLALLRAGIVCSEVLIYGEEENLTLSLVTFGNADVKIIAQVATQLFNAPMMISERLPLSDEKFCCVLRRKPHFDAAFGVASARKKGATVSGDTHSVIKIDERKFMVALSDGMGSGEYARRVSENTITLLESFYRAKMPAELILSSVNKLLTFNKEESFSCVDIAIVDLDSGLADVVKIGSPIAFILSGNTVKILESASLPLGILDCLHPHTATYQLEENDVLLFISDGISDAFGTAADLYECLRAIPTSNPQLLAERVLEGGLRASGGVAKDDMTAVAVRLFKQTQ